MNVKLLSILFITLISSSIFVIDAKPKLPKKTEQVKKEKDKKIKPVSADIDSIELDDIPDKIKEELPVKEKIKNAFILAGALVKVGFLKATDALGISDPECK